MESIELTILRLKAGLKQYDLLFTEEELKKTTMAYFAGSGKEDP